MTNNKKQITIFIFSVIAIVFLTVMITVNIYGNKTADIGATIDENVSDWNGTKKTYTGEKSTDSISIPGFDFINFKADVTTQATNFYNPSSNNCYFRISLILDNNTLWKSDLIKPGKAVYNIETSKALGIGEYKDAKLKYECFSLNNTQKELNGSEITLCINVIK